MLYTHVLNRGGRVVTSPADPLPPAATPRHSAEGWAAPREPRKLPITAEREALPKF